MIALETFQKFHWPEVLAIVGMAVLFAGAQFGLTLLDARIAYYGSLLLFGMALSFGTMFVRKAGAATLIALLSALLSIGIASTGTSGVPKVLSFAIAGILFELAFLILKLEVHLVPIDILLGTALAVASIPFTTLLLLSPTIAAQHTSGVLNLMLLGFCIGILANVLSFLLWYNLERTKAVLKFEYGG